MSLKLTRILMFVLSGAILAAAFLMPYNTVKIYTVIALFTALVVVGYKFLRCPYCGAQLKMWGMDKCPDCGEPIDWKS